MTFLFDARANRHCAAQRWTRRCFGLFLILSLQAHGQSEELDSIFLLKLIPKSLLTSYYRGPDLASLPDNRISQEIKYGYELITRTAEFIGPEGSVGKYAGNRLNCSNCHLDAGQRLFGGAFATTHGRYPEYRSRDDIIISLADRINYCIERPHNGKWLPQDTREMRAMLMYIKWLGQDRAINSRQFGDQLMTLRDLDRAADPRRGEAVYRVHCEVCHGKNGEGQWNEDGKTHLYPPLWGPDSYSIGSSMHRVRPAAAFIKANMPLGVTWEKPLLSDEEAFDVAAFINDDRIHPRPSIDVSRDYPDRFEKPIDYPSGPYIDGFSEVQHKFGPWKAIKEARKRLLKERARGLEPTGSPLEVP